MQVIKRDGRKEEVSFDKVLERIRRAADGLAVNPTAIAQQVLIQIYDGVKTTELDDLTCQLSASLTTTHPDYGTLAARVAVSNHHKNTEPNFTAVVRALSSQTTAQRKDTFSYVSQDILAICEKHGDVIDARIDHQRDYLFDYFGFKTLEKSYLLKDSRGKVLERPQHLWMRVSLAMWGSVDLERAFETYDMMSQKYFIHATPTLFNAGTPHPQLSSCFLMGTDDSISGIYKTLSDCASISKFAGGIGLHVNNIRARGSVIRGTNGTSNGLVPMLRVFNNTARYVDQGGGKRNGSFAIYLEPWHADVEDFLRMKLNTGAEEERARDLFYALWVPDLFMERVEAAGTWSLFCPDEAPGLADAVGPAFKELYERYEREGRARKTVEAQKLWFQILDTQIETGTPYICYKDAANLKSNQQNLGTIKSSNLCVAPETMILTKDAIKTDGNQYATTYNPIYKLTGKTVDIWNGEKWSTVTVTKTGENQKLLRVTVSMNDGLQENIKVLYCTEYHKFLLPSPTGKIADCPRVEAKDLVSGTTLQGWKNANGAWVHQKVVSVEFDGRYDDTYCFNEPDNHAGVFNGILTGNCTEIIEYSDKDETAVCNLASLALPSYVNQKTRGFDYDALRKATRILVRNLNRVIDINYYPTPETLRSNMRHRPIGLGVQGLADVFALMRLPWESEKAEEVNQRIFEHIYYAALDASVDEAVANQPYETFAGSPAAAGRLQPDLWGVTPLTQTDGTLDWAGLRERVKSSGIRNSLLVAPMPTASTSQILGFNECFEPFTTNIYTRRTLAGEFIVVNKYLMRDLMRYDLWSPEMKQRIIAANGSIQAIDEIPDAVKKLYKTSWEIKQRTLIDMAAARGAFVCQSQSLNLFVAEPTYAKLTSMHFYSWKKGLKTGCYYLRTRPAVMAQKFTVDPRLLSTATAVVKPPSAEEVAACQRDNGEGCLLCSA